MQVVALSSLKTSIKDLQLKRRKYNVHDTRRRLREEDEQTTGQENGHDRATELGDELVSRLGAQEVTGLQISRHVRRLGG